MRLLFMLSLSFKKIPHVHDFILTDFKTNYYLAEEIPAVWLLSVASHSDGDM